MAKQTTKRAFSPRQTLDGQRVLRITGLAMKVATWNVRSLHTPGKLENVVAEMSRLGIGILGISDVQRSGTGKVQTKNGMLYFSGNNNLPHRYGVGIILDKSTNGSVVSFLPLSERIMVLKLDAKPVSINLIQVYAPTADKTEDEIEDFYRLLNVALGNTKRHEINIIMGDFNAKVGEGEVERCVGRFGLGTRNERGDRLVEFCQNEKFVIMNTFFKLPKRRLWTWKSPADTDDNVVRNQIDYILINDRYKNSVKSVKTYPGADVNSDHNPVVSNIKVSLKKLKRTSNRQKLDVRKLKNKDVLQKVQQKVNTNLKALPSCQEASKINEAWVDIKNAIVTVGQENLRFERKAKQTWMTQEILNLMDERRQNKNNAVKYKEINQKIKKKIKDAKENWIHRECKEIEEYERKYDSFNLHKKIKEMTGTTRHQNATVIKDKDGNLISDIQQQLIRWSEYVKELFNDNRPEITSTDHDDTGPPILREEILHAIKQTKEGKADSPDELPVENSSANEQNRY